MSDYSKMNSQLAASDSPLNSSPQTTTSYQPAMSRRDSLKIMLALATSSMFPLLTGCEQAENVSTTAKTTTAGAKATSATTEHWPDLKLSAINAKGYGKDPNLILPPKSPWPLTLTPAELTLVAVLADILLPRDGNTPSASEVQVPAVVNEWVSAPYERQQQDRLQILSALAWIDDEAELRFSAKFVSLNNPQQLAIIDDIAFNNADTQPQFKRIATAFNRFRGLVLAAFFATPEGTKDLGYLGNTAIAGDYPGPTAEAKTHLAKKLQELGLAEFAYQPG